MPVCLAREFELYPVTSRESVEVFKQRVYNPLYSFRKIIGVNVGD